MQRKRLGKEVLSLACNVFVSIMRYASANSRFGRSRLCIQDNASDLYGKRKDPISNFALGALREKILDTGHYAGIFKHS